MSVEEIIFYGAYIFSACLLVYSSVFIVVKIIKLVKSFLKKIFKIEEKRSAIQQAENSEEKLKDQNRDASGENKDGQGERKENFPQEPLKVKSEEKAEEAAEESNFQAQQGQTYQFSPLKKSEESEEGGFKEKNEGEDIKEGLEALKSANKNNLSNILKENSGRKPSEELERLGILKRKLETEGDEETFRKEAKDGSSDPVKELKRLGIIKGAGKFFKKSVLRKKESEISETITKTEESGQENQPKIKKNIAGKSSSPAKNKEKISQGSDENIFKNKSEITRRELENMFKDIADPSFKSYWAAKKSGLGNMNSEERRKFMKDFGEFYGGTINEKEYRDAIRRLANKYAKPEERARIKKEISFLKKRAGIK